MSNLHDPYSGRMLRDDETQLAFKTPQITLMLPLPMARLARIFQRFV
jgi:hypothetical protein